MAYAIEQTGSVQDAKALLACFLQEPTSYYHAYVLPVIAKWGDKTWAADLFDACFEQRELKEDVDNYILEMMGLWQYEPAQSILADYAFRNKGYYDNKSAVLGLLHFDCEAIETKIRTAIEGVLTKNIFQEYLPALVCKLKDKTEILKKLYDFGCTICSSDCNAGLLLGLALSGEEGRVYFKKALWHPYWESTFSSTGSIFATYKGMIYLNMSIIELYEEVKNTELVKKAKGFKAIGKQPNETVLKYQTNVILDLLSHRIDQPAQEGEAFLDLFAALYRWENSNKSNNLVDLARTFGLEERAYTLNRLLVLRMREAFLFKNKHC